MKTDQNKRIRPVGYLFALLFALALLGCDGRASGTADGTSGAAGDGGRKIEVVCTTTMIADLARHIAGDDAEVVGIMKTGEDPHVYDVRPRDAQLIAEADVVLMNGLHLESTLLHVIEHNAEGAVVKALAEDERIETLGSVTTAGAPDPHCWFNVPYFKVYAERACDALSEADPVHAEAFAERTAAYIRQLEELDVWVTEQIDSVPRERRVMVTSHDAFEYYGARYGIDVLAVIGISTEQQPKPQDITALKTQVSERGVKALFIETSVSRTLNDIVKKVAEDTGASIGGTLYSDSLGEPGTEAGTYIGMVRHNTRTIAEALR